MDPRNQKLTYHIHLTLNQVLHELLHLHFVAIGLPTLFTVAPCIFFLPPSTKICLAKHHLYPQTLCAAAPCGYVQELLSGAHLAVAVLTCVDNFLPLLLTRGWSRSKTQILVPTSSQLSSSGPHLLLSIFLFRDSQSLQSGHRTFPPQISFARNSVVLRFTTMSPPHTDLDDPESVNSFLAFLHAAAAPAQASSQSQVSPC